MSKSQNKEIFVDIMGIVVDAVVIDDFCLQNTDSDGYTWYVGFHFEIGN